MTGISGARGAQSDGTTPDRHRWAGSTFLLVAIAMILVDTTVVNLALPTIQRDLGASSSQLQWVVATYTLSFALFQVTAGRIGDLAGRRRMVLAGIAGFVVASAICALAPSIAVLLVGRVLQGLTGAFIITQSLSIFQVSFPPGERATILGLFGAVSGISAALGPPLAGLLMHADIFGLGWRPIFLINLPIGLATLIGAALFVRESRSERPPKLDLAGVLGLSVALLALLYPLIQGGDLGWPLWTIVLMIASIPLFGLFWWQQKVRDRAAGTPLVPPYLFQRRAFVIGLIVCLVFFGAAFSLFFVFAIFLQNGLGYSVLHAALTTMVSPASTVVAAVASSRIAARFGTRVLTAGALISACGQLVLIWIINAAGATASPWHFIPAMVLVGAGIGLVVGPLVDLVLARVPLRDAGSASGLLNTADQLGVAVGVAVLGTVFFGWMADARQAGAGDFPAYASGLEASLWVSACLLLGSMVLTLGLPRRTHEPEPVDVDDAPGDATYQQPEPHARRNV